MEAKPIEKSEFDAELEVIIIDQKKAAKFAGVTPRTIRRWKKEGMPLTAEGHFIGKELFLRKKSGGQTGYMKQKLKASLLKIREQLETTASAIAGILSELPQSPKTEWPGREQFQEFKKKYLEAILFFRMGDFFESYYNDAKICSQVLGLPLITRRKGENHVRLVRIPTVNCEMSFRKMGKEGYTLAIFEQIQAGGSVVRLAPGETD